MCGAKRVFHKCGRWLPGQATTDQQLFKVAAKIPVAMLDVTLEPHIAAFIGKTPEIHVPRTCLTLVYLSQRRRDKKSGSYGDRNAENVKDKFIEHSQKVLLLAKAGVRLRDHKGRAGVICARPACSNCSTT
jgi:hypothetical protein